MIVDSLLHINETLYESIIIHDLFKKSGLFGYAIFGISVDTNGLLFDIGSKNNEKLPIPQTNISKNSIQNQH